MRRKLRLAKGSKGSIKKDLLKDCEGMLSRSWVRGEKNLWR